MVTSACADYKKIAGIPYDTRHGGSTTLDLYLPGDVGPDTPAIMLIHGGGWRYFSKEVYKDHGARLADAGFVVASINYRLVPEGAYPRIIQDCFCALGFLQANAEEYFLDPERIAVAGYSAGGHLTSLIAVAEPSGDFEPDCGYVLAFPPAAAISGAGPTDLRKFPKADSIKELLGGSLDEIPELFERASPITHVGPNEPPFLFIAGSDDLFVPWEQTELMDKALRDAGNDSRVLKLRGGGHLTNPGGDLYDAVLPITSADTPEAWAATIDFLDEQLGRP